MSRSHPTACRIGFVSTRFQGTDGVSLETRKWQRALEDDGHACCFFAGEVDWPKTQSCKVPEAHFAHPAIERLGRRLFGVDRRDPEVSSEVDRLKHHLKDHLARFVRDSGVDLLIAENVLSLPMNVPLGLAVTELLAESGLPAVAHHHDFYWERTRFMRTAAADYLTAAFPPMLPSVRHVVINSFAAHQLASRSGAASVVVPNVMDFADEPPDEPDAYAADLRSELGLEPDERLVLQPTRVVPRKRIEKALELVRRLDQPAALVVSHASGDENDDYQGYLVDHAEMLGVKLIFADDRFAPERGRDEAGRKVYSLEDAYLQADLVTYPSLVEGFGNAFLEAVYYRRPIVMSRYDIFQVDIAPLGFEVIGFDGFVDADTVRKARRALVDEDFVRRMTEHNYQLGRDHFSMEVLTAKLRLLIDDCRP